MELVEQWSRSHNTLYHKAFLVFCWNTYLQLLHGTISSFKFRVERVIRMVHRGGLGNSDSSLSGSHAQPNQLVAATYPRRWNGCESMRCIASPTPAVATRHIASIPTCCGICASPGRITSGQQTSPTFQ